MTAEVMIEHETREILTGNKHLFGESHSYRKTAETRLLSFSSSSSSSWNL